MYPFPFLTYKGRRLRPLARRKSFFPPFQGYEIRGDAQTVVVFHDCAFWQSHSLSSCTHYEKRRVSVKPFLGQPELSQKKQVRREAASFSTGCVRFSISNWNLERTHGTKIQRAQEDGLGQEPVPGIARFFQGSMEIGSVRYLAWLYFAATSFKRFAIRLCTSTPAKA